MTPSDLVAMLVRLAVEAGADPARADERMRQAAQAVTAEMDVLHVRLAARAIVIAALRETLDAERKQRRSVHA